MVKVPLSHHWQKQMYIMSVLFYLDVSMIEDVINNSQVDSLLMQQITIFFKQCDIYGAILVRNNTWTEHLGDL